MKSLIVSLVTLVACNSALAAESFMCPSHGTMQSRETMYSVMKPGRVFGSNGSDSSQIAFVDEEHELKLPSGDLTPIGTTFLNDLGEVDFNGAFKIGYDYSAKECRRQIVLEEQVAPGVWKGYTAIEICNPKIAALITQTNATNFDEVYANLKVLADQAQAASEKIFEDAQKNPVCDYNDKANYDQTKCDALYQPGYAMSDQAQKLYNLEIRDEHKGHVEYFKDSNGIVLPRFKVELVQFFFERNLAKSYEWDEETETETYTESKVCSMDVVHAVSYAGLAGSYNWDFSYEKPYTAQIWTYDANGQSVKTDNYANDPSQINFLDLDEYFYVKGGYY